MLVDSGPANLAEKTLAVVRDLARRVTSSPMPAQVVRRHGAGVPVVEQLGAAADHGAARGRRAPSASSSTPATTRTHVGGNAVIGAAGRTFGVRNIDNTSPGASVVAHENAALRLSRSGQDKLVASESYAGRDKKLNFFNGEGVVVTHPDSAHTDGDSIVYFRGSDVLAVGDVVNMTSYPVIDAARGGTVNGLVEALNWILDVCVVEHMMEGGTIVVPGHGRLMDTADVAYYRDMVDDHARPRARDAQARHDARADQGGAADARLRRPLRQEPAVDAGDVRRGDLSHARSQVVGHPMRRFLILCAAVAALSSIPLAAQQGRQGAPGPAAAAARRARRRAAARRRPSISPATGCRSSPTTGATGC